jgi:acetyl-CoA carboxylase biotin carboxyl carrier protein
MIDIDHLVTLLDEKSLTHLEYEPGDGSRIVIKREPAAVAGTGLPFVGATCGRPLEYGKAATLGDSEALTAYAGEPNSPLQRASQPQKQPGTAVTAPLVGVVYLRKEPDAPKFVELGAPVEAGDVLCLIEAMKMFSEITAPVAGTITSIDIADGELAEFGAPLFTIEPQLAIEPRDQ